MPAPSRGSPLERGARPTRPHRNAPRVARFPRASRKREGFRATNASSPGNALAELLATDVSYVGVLGPARRTERLLQDIASERGPIAPERRARVFGPAGLALGAEPSAEIALSIVAEAQATLTRAQRSSLRDRNREIHEPVALVLHGDPS